MGIGHCLRHGQPLPRGTGIDFAPPSSGGRVLSTMSAWLRVKHGTLELNDAQFG
jgi:hypothetical protein